MSNDLLELQRAVQIAEKAGKDTILYKGQTMMVSSAIEYINYIKKAEDDWQKRSSPSIDTSKG